MKNKILVALILLCVFLPIATGRTGNGGGGFGKPFQTGAGRLTSQFPLVTARVARLPPLSN
jgi:hypothetical protein